MEQEPNFNDGPASVKAEVVEKVEVMTEVAEKGLQDLRPATIEPSQKALAFSGLEGEYVSDDELADFGVDTSVFDLSKNQGFDDDEDDIILPALIVCRDRSKAEEAGIKPGSIVETGDGEFRTLCGPDEALHFVPVHREKGYVVMQKIDQNNWKQLREEPFVAKAKKPEIFKEFHEKNPENGGVAICVRKPFRRFFIVIIEEMEQGNDLPFKITFKGRNFKAGRQLYTQSKSLEAKGINPAKAVFELRTRVVEDNNGKGYAFAVNKSRFADAEELASTSTWMSNPDKLVRLAAQSDDAEEEDNTPLTPGQQAKLNNSVGRVQSPVNQFPKNTTPQAESAPFSNIPHPSETGVF